MVHSAFRVFIVFASLRPTNCNVMYGISQSSTIINYSLLRKNRNHHRQQQHIIIYSVEMRVHIFLDVRQTAGIHIAEHL